MYSLYSIDFMLQNESYKTVKAKQKSLTHFHLAQGGRNFEEVHDISSLKLANLLCTMENLESLQLSSLLSTYDQGQGNLPCTTKDFLNTKVCEGNKSRNRTLLSILAGTYESNFSLEKCFRQLVLMKLKVIPFFQKIA